MKAIFSRLRSKEPHEEKHKGKENNGPDNNVRKFAQGFSSLSRATGGKTLQPRQSSTLYTIEKQPPTTETARPSRPASANLLSSPYDTPIFNRSASLYVPADTTRPVTPVGDLVVSSLENSLLHEPEQGNTTSSEHTNDPRPSIAEHTTVPTKPTPTSDADGTFTTSSTTTAAGKSFARRWLGRTSQGPITSQSSKSKPPTTLNRKDSASSSLSSRFGSRSLSGALSPVSTRSRQSAVSGEDQEYCKSRQSWTGMAEVDLVAHLGAQERTRQEVLFEIVSSEEKYVLDLIKMKETFIDKLIPQPVEERLSLLPDPLSKSWSRHSESTSSLTSPNQVTSKFGSRSVSRADTTGDDLDRLPIAAHFTTSRSATPVGGLLPPLIIQHDLSESNQPSSPPRSKIYEGEEDLDATIRIKRTYHHLSRGQPSAEELDVPVEDNVFAHKALPPLPLPAVPTRLPQDPAARERVSKRPVSGQSLKPTISSESTNPPDRWSRRFSATRKRNSAGAWSSEMADSCAITLPEDLRIVLEVTRDSILKGHIALSDALRKRYDDQYPLVRGLADIFIEHSHLFQEYGKFVIHLERAIQQLDDCQGAFESNKKKLNDASTNSLAAAGSAIQALNQTADDKGETGLAISLSKPFQRLLKYPLLFQNLLYNTDATLSEYDSCMTLLSEVDGIVRALEDEKADEDERERTRDTLARIEGLERDPTLSLPRSTRISIGETPAPDIVHASLVPENTNRRSLRRLSDLMRGNDHIDLWEVSFSDVTLICQKIGSTSMPMYSRTGKGNDEGRIHVKSKTAKTGRRSRQIEPRNLYRFVSVKEWHSEKQDEPSIPLGNAKPERRPSTSGESAISHPESIKEESSEESDSDDSEQMDFILGAAAPRRRASTRPELTTTTDHDDIMPQATSLPDSPKKTVPVSRTARISSRSTAKGTLPSRARSPTEMINSQAKFGTRLRNPELSMSMNGRSSAMARPVGSSAIVRGENAPSKTSQRAVSTPVNSVARGSTRPPPSSVRGTRRQIQVEDTLKPLHAASSNR